MQESQIHIDISAIEKGLPPAVDSRSAPAFRDKVGVLVVDDDPNVRAVVQIGLERNGFNVATVPNGREAIDVYRLHAHEIGVVLLDVRMPGLDGMQTFDALRELNPGVQVCFMSGDTGDYEPAELLKHGAVRLINKPFSPGDLADVVRLMMP